MKDIPVVIKQMLNKWEPIALFAYEGLEREGRGAVCIFLNEDPVGVGYAPRHFFAQQENAEILKMIDEYDPSLEVLICFEPESDQTRVIRVRTPDGARHPRRIWFFKVLAREEQPQD